MKKRILSLLLCLITVLSLVPAPVSADAAPLEITSQPESCSVKAGDTLSLKVTAAGEGLSYLWFFSDDGTTFQETGVTADTYTETMTQDMDGRKFYCLITDQDGNTIQSETVTVTLEVPEPEIPEPEKLQITQQPKNARADLGKKASATVVATGEGLKYQWYLCNPGKTKFTKSSITSKTYTVTVSKSNDGRKIYCVITDKDGNSVTSDTVTVGIAKAEITKQPKNSSAHPGKKVSTSVTATGKGLKYQWYVCKAGSTKFSKSSITSKTYSTTMDKSRDGRKVYCVVTDKNGYTAKSKTVTLRMLKPEITQQPENCYTPIGETASTSVAVSGEGLKYQWYFKDAGTSKFSKASTTKSTYKVKMSDKRNGRKIYCVITDSYGASVTSATVTLKVPEYAKITKQPQDTRILLNTTGSCSVGATGDGLRYQWYVSDDGGNTYTESSIKKSAYSVKMVLSKSGRLVYCVVTDRYGNSVQSKPAKLLAQGEFKLGQYSLKVGATKKMAPELDFTTDEALTWKSSNSSVVSVTGNGVITRHKKGTVTITVTGAETGVIASCRVRVPGTKQVALTFDDGPSTHTARFLDYLATTDAKVTFFMVGNRMNSYKETVKRMAKQGHELGYHSWDHYNQTKRPDSQIISEYNKANKILKNLTKQEFTVWRTPGGAFNDRVLKCVPLPHIFWSSSTQDWRTRNADKVYSAILKQAKDGAIILLHDLHGTTVDGAIRAMKKLEKEGYEFVTVTELLSRNGTAPKPSVSYHKG